MQYTIIPFLDVLKGSNTLRLEAEYFIHPSSIKPHLTGEEIIDFVQYGTSEELNEERIGYLTLRLNEFDNLFIGAPAKYCSRITLETYEKLRLKKGDVLICRTNGNPKLVGKSAIVMADTDYCYASYLFKVRPKTEFINPQTLCVYLNSKIGRMEIERFTMISNQANFSPAKFREIAIPQFSDTFQSKIASIVEIAYQLSEKAKNQYISTETVLLSELDLRGWQPRHQLCYVKRFSDTQTAGRIDAEYFQPMHDAMIVRIQAYKHGYSKLDSVVKIKDKNYNPNPRKEYKYIELSNISANGNIAGFIETTGDKLPTRARRKVVKGDVIVSSIEGSLESIALINNDFDEALCSSGFYVIHSNEINSETLLLLLKTVIGQIQLKKGCNGTILTAININEFKGIILPKIPEDLQMVIKNKITKMYHAQAQSKNLFDIAKISVEMAIKHNEVAADQWINNQLFNLQIEI